MAIPSRTPVIVGVAQVSRRPSVDDDPLDNPDPIDLMSEAVRAATADAGVDTADAGQRASNIKTMLDSIAVVGGLWRYRDPGALIADELGLEVPHTLLTTFGGNLPIHVTHHLAERIQTGEFEMVAIAGGECNQTRQHLARRGEKAPRRQEPDVDRVERWGPPIEMGDGTAVERGGETPRNTYAILDSALRAARGESVDEARDRAADLWAGYAAVAAENPHAADRRALSADAIRTITDDNRMVSWPYTKAMCANNTVDHAGAIIMCTQERADALGVPPAHRIYPQVCITATDTASLLERDDLTRAPGLEAAAAAAVAQAGSPAALEHLDLYSCFPSIVRMTSEALGVDPGRPLTVSGGLAFAGAPLNFAAGEALIAMVETLRADPGTWGLVQGNGGHANKHAFGLYSSSPPEEAHRIIDLGHFASSTEAAEPQRSGPATIDGFTVEFERDGPARAIAIVHFADGARGWAVGTERDVIDAFLATELVGETVQVRAGEMQLGPDPNAVG